MDHRSLWYWPKLKTRHPHKWHNWPVGVGWFYVSDAWITWHCWPVLGTRQNPDATAYDLGWTLHLGPLKVYFGRPVLMETIRLYVVYAVRRVVAAVVWLVRGDWLG